MAVLHAVHVLRAITMPCTHAMRALWPTVSGNDTHAVCLSKPFVHTLPDISYTAPAFHMIVCVCVCARAHV